MAFDTDGFLSEDLGEWMTKTKADHRDWFDLANHLNREGMKLLFSAEPSNTSNKQLLAALLYGRALQSYQGVVLLSERGMLTEARTLVRSCAESAIALCAVALDEKFIDELISDYDRHRLCIANVFANDTDCKSDLTPEQIEKLRETAREIKDRNHPNTPQSINWATVATKTGTTALYNTIYRGISGDAAHATIEALNRHIKSDAESNIEHLTFRPSVEDLNDTLSAGISAMLHAMDALSRSFEREAFSQVVASLGARWRALELPQNC